MEQYTKQYEILYVANEESVKTGKMWIQVINTDDKTVEYEEEIDLSMVFVFSSVQDRAATIASEYRVKFESGSDNLVRTYKLQHEQFLSRFEAFKENNR